MHDPRPIITLTTDFGEGSPYVAQMKGVILAIAPQVNLVDVTHAIAPQDVRQGALVLADVVPRFPAGTIHVAVIDPGVGTGRKIVATRCGQSWLVGPDNGLFGPVAKAMPVAATFEVCNPAYRLAEVSRTFHGRDIMAPAAAHLACGIDPPTLGPPVETLVELAWPQPTVTPDKITGEVISIDTFGNLLTNISQTPQLASGDWLVRLGEQTIGPLVATYATVAGGSPLALIGSGGKLEIAVAGGSAAQAYRAKVGDLVAAHRKTSPDA